MISSKRGARPYTQLDRWHTTEPTTSRSTRSRARCRRNEAALRRFNAGGGEQWSLVAENPALLHRNTVSSHLLFASKPRHLIQFNQSVVALRGPCPWVISRRHRLSIPSPPSVCDSVSMSTRVLRSILHRQGTSYYRLSVPDFLSVFPNCGREPLNLDTLLACCLLVHAAMSPLLASAADPGNILGGLNNTAA